MTTFKTKKNLIGVESEYSRHYTKFRGVDFSSDHTQINEHRLAYLSNMYRDYQTGKGEALETIVGFRERFVADDSPIYGIHEFDYIDNNGTKTKKVLVHAGNYIWKWDNYPQEYNVGHEKVVYARPSTPASNYLYADISGTGIVQKSQIVNIYYIDSNNQKSSLSSLRYDIDSQDSNLIKISNNGDIIKPNSLITVAYKLKARVGYEDTIFNGMNNKKSISFVFNNRMYILDGANYLVYYNNGTNFVIERVRNSAHIPLWYDNGVEVNQRNILSDKVKFGFVGDGETTVFTFPQEIQNTTSEGDRITVVVDGVELSYLTDFTYTMSAITFVDAPPAPELEGVSNIIITAKKQVSMTSPLDTWGGASIIEGCTLATIYDNRVFLGGNPKFPNRVFFSQQQLGVGSQLIADPTYFGELNWDVYGVTNSKVNAMMVIADTLMLLKEDSQEEPTTYFIQPQQTGEDLRPVIYPKSSGLSGVGCLGACINFLDDPVFVSKLGLSAIGQLSVRLERAKEHRSTLVDAKLVNSDLKNASMCEYGGYLWLLVDGQIFLADSRQRFQNSLGNYEYEWYYLSDIGSYHNQYEDYQYAKVPPFLANEVITYNGNEYTLEETNIGEHTNSNAFVTQYKEITYEYETYTVPVTFLPTDINGVTHLYYCETNGGMTGGTFNKATFVKNIDNNVFFGTYDGVFSFNFDQRNDYGEIPTYAYSFNGRAIVSGCATLMDNCGVPHLTKSTIKRSTVIKTKSYARSSAKVKVRTNKDPYKQIARISQSTLFFDDMDFSDFSFITTDQSLVAIKEKEKQWVEKQYYIYSDEYLSPFALYYISFRYKIAGRLKQ